jgi:acetyl-CoA synthetase
MLSMNPTHQFISARDELLTRRCEQAVACETFRWPALTHFNWVQDYFDVIAQDNRRVALRVVGDEQEDIDLTFSALAARAAQVANYLTSYGIERGDRVLIMLGNVVPLWEVMLGLIRIGAVIIPTTTLLQRDDLSDRLGRGRVQVIIAEAIFAPRFDAVDSTILRIAVGGPVPGWSDYGATHAMPDRHASELATRADDPLLLYFTSGTTARPKLVVHTHQSYPVGHLSTMYWLGLKPGDIHLNVSSPGWAKHAWSSFFAPWNAEATILAYQYKRFSARALLDQLVRCEVTTFCAPPTVWRMLIQEDLARWAVTLREIASAGEPLNPEVIEQVRSAWGLTVRDGFGQTETTAQVGNAPGQVIKLGSMGRPLPGCSIVLLAPDGSIGDEGEICIDLAKRPVPLMQGYLDDPERSAEATAGGYYHTGDVARRDEEGYLWYVGRVDDVFKSADYRISPFELESVLIEHPHVAEAAVVASPHSLRLAVPKAFILLAGTASPDAATARSILVHVRGRVSPYKRIRRIEFRELPKTISGKIRRVDLRREEAARLTGTARLEQEFWEEDFPDLRSPE